MNKTLGQIEKSLRKNSIIVIIQTDPNFTTLFGQIIYVDKSGQLEFSSSCVHHDLLELYQLLSFQTYSKQKKAAGSDQLKVVDADESSV